MTASDDQDRTDGEEPTAVMASPPPPPPPPAGGGGNTLSPGTMLGHTYRITAFLARGGMGEVYRATHDTLGTEHAIKIIRPELADVPEVIELFRREAMTLRRIHHRGIVSYDGLFRDEQGRTYLVMEFVDGPSLGQVMRERALSVEEVRKVRRRAAEALAVAHEEGVFHRDLSPDNIIFERGDFDHPKIIDFGIAKLADPSEKTVVGDQFAGKYSYVSPEQFGLYGGQVDGRADIYSLGLVLAAAALGEKLDMGHSLQTAVARRDAVPDLSALPAELRGEIGAMLAPDPKNRPQSMRDLVEAEVSRLPGTGAATVGVPGARKTQDGPQKGGGRLGLWLGLGALVVVAGGAGGVAVLKPELLFGKPEPVVADTTPPLPSTPLPSTPSPAPTSPSLPEPAPTEPTPPEPTPPEPAPKPPEPTPPAPTAPEPAPPAGLPDPTPTLPEPAPPKPTSPEPPPPEPAPPEPAPPEPVPPEPVPPEPVPPEPAPPEPTPTPPEPVPTPPEPVETMIIPVMPCDRLAADPEDRTRAVENDQPVAGMSIADMDEAASIAACEKAVAAFPDVARFHFQLGRALFKARQYARTVEEMEKAAEGGHDIARGDLAYLYLKGPKGVPRDIARAIRVGTPAAEAGVVSAMYTLGEAYAYSEPKTQDYVQARHWYARAADEGAAQAMFALAQLFEKGLGGPVDRTQARLWYQRAADGGYARATDALKRLDGR